jgi:hypothetical protein
MVAAVFCLSLGLLDNALVNANSISFQTARDCNSNAIISCGSLTTVQLISAYNSNSYAQKVYTYFGISSNDIKNLPTTATAGHVDKHGNVYLDGHSSPVATNAITVGRQNTAGSQTLSSSGATFYTRPLSLALTTNSADAFVVMDKARPLMPADNKTKATYVPDELTVLNLDNLHSNAYVRSLKTLYISPDMRINKLLAQMLNDRITAQNQA